MSAPNWRPPGSQLPRSCRRRWWHKVGLDRPPGFPRYRPVADRRLLVEFGETIDERVHNKVVELDMALAATPFDGFAEAVPAYASILISFDPIVTDHRSVEAKVDALLSARAIHRG